MCQAPSKGNIEHSVKLCLGGKSRDTFCRWILLWKIKFPPEYPYKPPGITMITHSLPMDGSGHKKICLSMSDFHPGSWNPMWSVSSPALRKLFPEYVDMYNQQQLPEQQVSEQQSTE